MTADKKTKNTLVLVYNADSDLASMVKDGVTKLATPSKYQCNLCMVSYGALSMKHEWREYLRTLPFVIKEFHRDEFRVQYPDRGGDKLPAIFLQSPTGQPEPFLSAEELSEVTDLAGLKALVSAKIEKL